MNHLIPGRNRGLFAALLAVAMFAIGGCSLNEMIDERTRIEYKSAGKLPPLEVPPDLVNPRGGDRFAVPELQKRERTFSGYQTARATEPRTAEPAVLPSVEGMRVERAGNERWLFVNQPPDKLWPILREFWQESGFLIASELPAAGVMETDWAENRAKIPLDPIRRTLGRVLDQLYSTGERDKFRTRLEAASGGTEVYISHRGMVEVYTTSAKDSTIWQPRPSDPDLEAEFLRRLMIKLGADQQRARTMVASVAQPGAAAEPLVTPAQGGDAVDIREGFDRAWRRVGLALDRGGFTVEDRDRSQGVYFVRYIDPEVSAGPKPGFFSRLFTSKPTKSSAQQYRVHLSGGPATTRVSVLGKDGQALSSAADRETGQKILALLREQLQQ